MKIEKIKQHLFLNDVFPAILLEDGTIKIMIQTNCYWSKEKFLEQEQYISGFLNTKEILDLFNYDYSNI